MKLTRAIIPISDQEIDLRHMTLIHGVTFKALPYSNIIGETYFVVEGEEKQIQKFIVQDYNPSAHINEFPKLILEF